MLRPFQGFGLHQGGLRAALRATAQVGLERTHSLLVKHSRAKFYEIGVAEMIVVDRAALNSL